MRAVVRTALADLSRRRLQSLVIALIILLTSGAGTLALSLLLESDAPYDHAFANAQGAHLTMTFAADTVSAAQLQATRSLAGITAAAGPWPLASVTLQDGNQAADSTTIAGRGSPNGPVDRLTMEQGRWWRSNGEVVISQAFADSTGVAVGDQVRLTSNGVHTALVVTGIAASISKDVDAWTAPSLVTSVAGSPASISYQMRYRVADPGSSAALATTAREIAAALPAGSVKQRVNYLDQKRNADRLSAVMIPFLLAFSGFALVASILIIVNAVAGVVIAGFRDIGVMKAIGFAPAQVVGVVLAQVLIPAFAGCLIGIPLGTLGSQPFLSDTAHALGLPAPFTAALPVDFLVLAVVLAATAAASLVPAWKAGRMSAVAAITRGSASAAGAGPRADLFFARLPLPRPVTLGLADTLARPARSAMTMGAMLVGVATVVFAIGLHLSLNQVASHLIRGDYAQVIARRATAADVAGMGAGGKPGFGGGSAPAPTLLTDGQVMALLRAKPAVARVVAEATGEVTLPNVAQPIPYYAYRGPSAWIGFALIAGHWFSGPGEVVAPSKLLSEAHLAVGDSLTARINGRPVRLKITGEILDQTGDDLLLRGDWATLAAADPRLEASTYEVGLRAGANPDAVAASLSREAGFGLDARAADRGSANTSFIMLNTVIAGLALVLIAIAVAGVFNTVVLSTRERIRDVAILKAIGMAPRQIISMVLCSVSFLGLIAGALGLPVGLLLQRQVLTFMGEVASGTRIPAAFFDLIDHRALPLLALSGIVVASVGAWLPAQWAAVTGVAEVLQTE